MLRLLEGFWVVCPALECVLCAGWESRLVSLDGVAHRFALFLVGLLVAQRPQVAGGQGDQTGSDDVDRDSPAGHAQPELDDAHHALEEDAGAHPGGGLPHAWRGHYGDEGGDQADRQDRKSTRLNSSHVSISYAVFCL